MNDNFTRTMKNKEEQNKSLIDKTKQIFSPSRIHVYNSLYPYLMLRDIGILELRYFKKYTYKQCGEYYDVSPQRARDVASRALRKMRIRNKYNLITQYYKIEVK